MVAVPMKLAWLLLGGLLALSGCSDDDHPPAFTPVPLPECPNESYDVCDVRATSCQARLHALAACMYGNEDPADVPVRVVSEPEFRAELEQSVAEGAAERPPKDEQARAAMERALVDLELIEPGALSEEARIDDIVRLFVGVYQDAEQGILLVDRDHSLSSVELDMLLVHEYIHALQDADYELDGWHENHLDTTDAVLAARSVTEGEATFYQMRAGVGMLGYTAGSVDFDATFDKLRRDLEESARADVSPYVASSATFPYGYGATVSNRLWQEQGQGFEAELFANVPTTTREIIRFAVYGNLGDDAREPLEHAAPTAAAPYALVDEDVLGAWITLLVLLADDETFDPTAVDVFSDHLWVYSDDAGETAWLWEVATNAPGAVQSRVDQLQQRLGGSVTLDTNRGRLYLAGGSDGVPDFLSQAGSAFITDAEP
ncbi:MAG TPA: hypothetical protein VIW29_13915 [Polyangiaceae bacterium]